MARCAFCGKQLGVFNGEVKIPKTEYAYCDSHAEYRVRMRRLLEENIDADLAVVISQFHGSLRQRADTCFDATTALVNFLKRDIQRISQEKKDEEAQVYAEAERLKRSELEKKEYIERIQKCVQEMKITTGFDFQGYRIIKYCDVIFDEIVVGMGVLNSIAAVVDNSVSAITGKEAVVATARLNQVKAKLRDQVKAKAAQIGANALIGIDFESSRIGDLLMISMTGTAVVIEPDDTQISERG